MMNPTHDAFDVDGKKGDTSDSPEEISFPYKLRDIKLYQARHKIDVHVFQNIHLPRLVDHRLNELTDTAEGTYSGNS